MYRLLAVLLVLSGCASLTAPADAPPTLEGPIVARDMQFGALNGTRNVHVRPQGDECGIVFAVASDTEVRVRTAEGKLRSGSLADLAVGRVVRVWSRGPILESCPGQGSAAAVEVVG